MTSNINSPSSRIAFCSQWPKGTEPGTQQARITLKLLGSSSDTTTVSTLVNLD